MKNNRDYLEMAQSLERVVNKYIRTQNISRDYNTGTEITRSEIHTIDIIGSNPKINVTQLAKVQGITKGAVSKMIYKLIDKELVIKKTSEFSDAEVCLYLTDKGKTAFYEHKRYHEEINKKMFNDFENFSDEEYIKIINLLRDVENMMDSIMNSKEK